MPHIDARAPAASPPAETHASATPPDWNLLPNELKSQIARWLDAGDSARLADVCHAWREVVVSPMFNRTARSVIAGREGLRPEACPVPPDRPCSGLAGELKANGFAHAAFLVDLHKTCEHLSSVPTDRAEYVTMPDLCLTEGTVYLPQMGLPELVAVRRSEEDLVLMSTNGTAREAHGLREMNLLADPHLTVTNTLLSPGATDAARVVLHHLDKSLHLFDVSNDVLQPLPQVFTLPEAEHLYAALSRDGRYVAATYKNVNDPDHRLLVHDRKADRTVTDTTLAGPLSYRISVDTEGTVLIGGMSRYEVKAGQDGQTVGRTAIPPHFIAVQLSPDEGHIVYQHATRDVVRLERRLDGHCIALIPGQDPSAERRACAIAFSPAMAMAAVTYDDGTLCVYDLLTIDDRTDVVHAKLHLPLRDAAPGRLPFVHPAAAWFDRDGGGVHAAYPLAYGGSATSLFRSTGLMHLRFQ